MSAVGLVATLAPSLIDLVRRFVPDKDKQAEAEREILQHIAAANDRMGEAMVTDAKSANWMQAMWRPMIGWVCVFGLTLEFLVFPIVSMVRGAFFNLGPVPTTIDAAGLMTLLLTIMGVGGLRTYEKYKGVA